LMTHAHVHCVIPAGGLSPDHKAWVHPRYRFFLPLGVMGRVFRGKFVAELKRAYRRKQLRFGPALAAIEPPHSFAAFLRRLFRQDWVVYAKPTCGGPTAVLRYLGRYIHRVAISNHRLLAFDGEHVTFRWKDYARGGKQRRMTLSAREFLRRFLQHVLPRGFVRIRHYGFLANHWRARRLPLCRELLASDAAPSSPEGKIPATSATWYCPRCGSEMVIRERLRARQIASRCGFFDSF